jgi:hypothetical protein
LVLAAIFIVCVLIAAGVVYAITSGGDDGAQGNGRSTNAAQAVKPGEIEVAVLNGTSVPGLAATFGEKVEEKGFEAGAVTNSSETFEDSVVMFKPGHEPEAKLVAKRISIPKVEQMSGEIIQVARKANVAVVVGEDNAEAAE